MTSEAQTIAANASFWEETYSRNFQKLCDRASRKLTRGRMSDAEDVVSNTFMKVMLAKQNTGDINNPLPYLWKAIQRAWFSQQAGRNVANMAQLEGLKMKTLEKLPSVRVEPKVLENLDRADVHRDMMCKLGPMSLKERTMVDMYIGGYSFSEIALELGEEVKVTRLRWRKMIVRQRTRGWAKRRKPTNL